MSSQDTQVNTVGYILFQKQIKYLKTLYLPRVARTCIFAVQVGTALIVLIPSLCPKADVVAIWYMYLFPVLQNCEDLLIKHNIDLVSTEYPRPQQNLA